MRRDLFLPVALLVAGSLSLPAACGPGTPATSGEDEPEAPPAAPVTTPTLDLAANATYADVWEGVGVTLSDGRYDNEQERRMALLLDDVTATGDLDGDGVDDRVVLIAESSGGTGSFVYLTVLLAGDGGEPLVPALVGDRVQLRSVAADEGRVTLGVVQAGEQDAMCCPGEIAVRTWTVRDGALQEEPMEVVGRLSLAAVEGEWQLVQWDRDEPADPQIPITLAIEGTRLEGSSGCNRYTAEATEGDAPGDLSVGPVAGTRMMCPDPQMEAERRFLAALGGAMKFGFLNGRLAVTTIVNDEVHSLLFEPVED